MVEISVQGNGLRATDDLIARLRDPSKPLAKVGAFLEGRAQERFLREQDPDGNPWAPLAPSTLADKQQRGAPDKILIDRGFLVAGFFFTVGGDEVRLKNTQEYLKWLQGGTRNMPARVVLGFEPNDPAAISKIFQRWLNGEL